MSGTYRIQHGAPFPCIDMGIDYRYHLGERERHWLWWACSLSTVRTLEADERRYADGP